MFLKEFTLLNTTEEANFIASQQATIYTSYYPFNIFPMKELTNIEFDKVTIFYGGNGSGKSTLLNIIARTINANCKNRCSKGDIFNQYLQEVKYLNDQRIDTTEIKFITSDDVFDSLLNIRAINAGVDRTKANLVNEYFENKFSSHYDFTNKDELQNKKDSKTKTMSTYVRQRLRKNNIVEQSNGETSLLYWEEQIEDNGIYILDEPENSLSATNQLKLKLFIEESARFYNCQFIIATHSPFLLNIKEALIYDLDTFPCTTKKYNELENIKVYKEFFNNLKDN